MIETDVLIMGSGPAGSAAALALSTSGIRNILVTKYRWLADTPRAHISNQRTMEVLRDLGVEEEVAARGALQEGAHGQHPWPPMASHGVPMGHSMGFTKVDTWVGMGKGDGPGMPHGGVRHAYPGHLGAMGFPMGTMPSLSWEAMGSHGPAHGRVMGRNGEWTETTRVGRHEAMAAGRASRLAMARAGGMAPLAGRRTLQWTTPR